MYQIEKPLLFDIWDIVKTGKFIPYDNISFERISDNKEIAYNYYIKSMIPHV